MGYTGKVIEALYTSSPGKVLVVLDDQQIVLPFTEENIVQPFVTTDEGVFWKHTNKKPKFFVGLEVTLCPDAEGQVQAIGRLDEGYLERRLLRYRLVERKGLKSRSALDRSSRAKYSVIWEGNQPVQAPRDIRVVENVDKTAYGLVWEVFDFQQNKWNTTHFNENWQEYVNETWIDRRFTKKRKK